MKYIIENKKSINLIIIITITIIIILLLIIYFYSNNYLHNKISNINNFDNFDNFDNSDNLNIFNTLQINKLPTIYGLIGAYTTDSFQNNKLKDLSNNGNDATITGVITVIDNYLTGTVDSSIEFPINILPSTYTLIHIAKYNSNNKGRIFSGIGSNWLSGFDKGNVGVAYHEGWISFGNNLPNDWTLSVDQNNLYRGNLNNFTTGIATGYTNLSVNSSKDEYLSKSDWAIACILVYNRILSLQEIQAIENYLVNLYNNLIYIKQADAPIIDPIIYTDDIIKLNSLIYQNIYKSKDNEDDKNFKLSQNVITTDNTYFDINKTSRILNINTNDDIELLMVDGKFRLKVNMPNMPPYIKGLNFDIINGVNPNYFYLSVIKLDPNCKIQSETKCENLYIDNKNCTNKILSDSIDSSYRLVLVPAFYAINDALPFSNIDFTLVKVDGLTYLKNINTGYLPKLYFNDNNIPIYGEMENDSNSNILKIREESNNLICNEKQSIIDSSIKTINVSCSFKEDSTLYLLTTKDINNSSPISFTINKNNTVNLNLNKYDIYGNLDDKLVLTSCNYDIDTFKYIEKATIEDLGQFYINLVCLDTSTSKVNNLDFMVELLDYSDEVLENSIHNAINSI
jgi:hypothetical protein